MINCIYMQFDGGFSAAAIRRTFMQRLSIKYNLSLAKFGREIGLNYEERYVELVFTDGVIIRNLSAIYVIFCPNFKSRQLLSAIISPMTFTLNYTCGKSIDCAIDASNKYLNKLFSHYNTGRLYELVLSIIEAADGYLQRGYIQYHFALEPDLKKFYRGDVTIHSDGFTITRIGGSHLLFFAENTIRTFAGNYQISLDAADIAHLVENSELLQMINRGRGLCFIERAIEDFVEIVVCYNKYRGHQNKSIDADELDEKIYNILNTR